METGALIVKDGWRRSLQRFGTMVLDQLYPPVCLSCDGPVATADTICSECFRALRPITAPLCQGVLIADVPAIVGSLDIVMGEIDR